jgi:hypothetical protein
MPGVRTGAPENFSPLCDDCLPGCSMGLSLMSFHEAQKKLERDDCSVACRLARSRTACTLYMVGAAPDGVLSWNHRDAQKPQKRATRTRIAATEAMKQRSIERVRLGADFACTVPAK